MPRMPAMVCSVCAATTVTLLWMLAACTVSPIAAGRPAASAPQASPPPVKPAHAALTADEILIPAGPFQMGCSPDDDACWWDESPLHEVMLDAYFIDKHEVTHARYATCVGAGGCTEPHTLLSDARANHYGKPGFADHPVTNVDWLQATAFCAWEGKRLPTEAEWEKAARGSSDTRIYPWGNKGPDCTRLNYVDETTGIACVGDTKAVGSYPLDASPYGVMDLGGNVQEWVHDWHLADYYAASPAANPQGPGPEGRNSRVLRGGSWGSFPSTAVRVSARSGLGPAGYGNLSGFRCARTP